VAVPTIVISLLLVGVGAFGYLNQDIDPEKGTKSITALIPAFVGGVLLLCGLLALVGPGVRKHAMHLAAVLGLLGFLGGFMPLQRQLSKDGAIDVTKPSAVSGLVMSGLCLLLVVLCVNSFIQARKARKAAGA
jgi:peptidoglycan/LPS O-acetylase OafA/YrhL